MSDIEIQESWLSQADLYTARSRLPVVYLNIVPVRTNELGEITHIGLLLQADEDGVVSRSIVTGRVLYGELIRNAIVRHIEKDLGPVSLPALPTNTTPFGVFEYFPDAGVTGYRDPRQHAVALGYVVSVSGDCQPSQAALDLIWIPASELNSLWLDNELADGHANVVRAALAHCGKIL